MPDLVATAESMIDRPTAIVAQSMGCVAVLRIVAAGIRHSTEDRFVMFCFCLRLTQLGREHEFAG